MTSMTTARREAIVARVRALNAALNPARETYLAEARRRAAEGRASAYEAYEAYRMATQAAWGTYEMDVQASALAATGKAA